ncbi:MAG: DUF4118 domain-containing protein [Firmicutes bacterium]|nr:DUF4118 domain-containing protein [Bacillota bacterium]
MFLESLKLSLKKKPTPEGWFTTVLILVIATLVGYALWILASGVANIALVYILALIAIAYFTDGFYYGLAASLIGVICVNYWFTYPYWRLNFTLTGYPITFVLMMATSIIVSSFLTHLKEQAEIIAERERALADAEKEKLRANLLRAVSHDLRTPLTTIIGSGESYLENFETLSEEEKRELVEQISDDSHWLLNMVENLLSVTRIQTSSTSLKKEPELVEEVLNEAVLRLKQRLPQLQISLTIPDDPIFLPMDAMLIEQVLMNLIENAFYHSGSKEPIACKVEESGHYILFRVIDFGMGISPELLPRLFDGTTYSRHQTADGHKGMGIGLTICKTIITAHGGMIHAKNNERGAEFYFSLPKEELSDEF